MMKFQPDRLRIARDRRGMTQRQLAELCGLLSNQISRYEQGANEPSTEVLARLAYHLGTTADYLIGLSDNLYGFENTDLRDDERELLAAYTVADTGKIMELSVARMRQLRGES